MLHHLNRYVMDNPQRVLVLVVVITLLALTQLPGLIFETDTEEFLPESQVVEDNERVQDHFGRTDKLAFVYLTPRGQNDNVLNFPSLRESLNLSIAVEQEFSDRGVLSVISIADLFNEALKEHLGTNLMNYSLTWQAVYNATLGADSGEISIEDVLFLFNLVLHRNWDYKEFLIPDDHVHKAPTAASTIIILNIDGELDVEARKELTNELRDMVEGKNTEQTQVKAQVASTDLLAYDVDQNTRTTNIFIALGMLVISVAVLGWAFRAPSYVILPMSTLVIALIWTFGLMAALNIPFTAIHVAVLPLIMGLGIDYTVHICRRYQEELGEGHDTREALLEATDHVGHALMLSATTTIIAFLSNLTAGVAPVQNFGLLAAAGISFVFLLTLTYHTALRYLLDTGQLPLENLMQFEKAKRPEAQPLLDKTLAITCTKVEGHPWAILFIVALVSGGAIYGAGHVETQFNTGDFLSDDLPVMITSQAVQQDFRGATYSQSAIFIEGQVGTPEFLADLAAVEENMRGNKSKEEQPDKFVLTRISDEPRVDSILTLARQIFEDHGTKQFQKQWNLTHGNITSPSFQVTPLQNYEFTWQTDQDQEYEAEVVWFDAQGEELERDELLPLGVGPHSAGKVQETARAPGAAVSAQVIYTYYWQLSLGDLSTVALDFVDYLVVFDTRNEPHLVFATSLDLAFNLDPEARPLAHTSRSDVENLYRYLFELDQPTDFYSNQTYAETAATLIHRDESGQYDAAVMWVYIGKRDFSEDDSETGLSNEDLETMHEELKADVAGLFPGQKVSVTGGHILTITTINALNDAQISSTILAILLAFIILTAIYRHWGLGLTAVFPLVLVTTWVLATMALTTWLNEHVTTAVPSVSLNVMTVMVTALTIGLGIDYAIHIIERYREERTHHDKADSITETIEHTGSALVISAATTIAGFGVLVFSPMPLVRNFGIITAATILYSLLVAVLVLPTLLLITGRLKTPIGIHRFPEYPYLGRKAGTGPKAKGPGKGSRAISEGSRAKKPTFRPKGTRREKRTQKLADKTVPKQKSTEPSKSQKPRPPGPIHSKQRQDEKIREIAREEADKLASETPNVVQHIHGDMIETKVEANDPIISKSELRGKRK